MIRATDFRVQIDFMNHPKFIKLSRLYGDDGVVSIIRLWAHAAAYKQDGVLTGMDEEELLIVCKQPETIQRDGTEIDNVFIQELVKPIRLLDQMADGTYCIHDWGDWQPWVSESKKRSEAGKKGAASRWAKKANATAQPKNLDNTMDSKQTYGNGNGSANAVRNAPYHTLPNSPLTPQGEERERDWVLMILEEWKSTLHELPCPKLTKSLRKKIENRLSEDSERMDLGWWKQMFLRVSRCPNLMGMGQSGFKASLSWLLEEKNLDKVESGFYQEEEGAKQTGWTEEEYAVLEAQATKSLKEQAKG